MVLLFCPRAYGEDAISLGVHPYLPTHEVQERFMPLAIYVGGKLKRPVTVFVSKDYREHEQKVGQNEYDLSYIGSASYVKMVQRYGCKPLLARLEVNGRPTFRGVIAVAKDSPVQTLGDLVGRSFAFGDPNSTMATVVPRRMLLDAGIELGMLSNYVYLSNHEDVALGILVGDFEAGGMKEEMFDRYKGEGLRSIAMSGPVSEYLLLAGSHLPTELISRIQEILYGMKDDIQGRAVLEKIRHGAGRMVPVTDEDYDSLRGIMNVPIPARLPR